MELNKRYNFNRRLTKEEVDHNWDVIEAFFNDLDPEARPAVENEYVDIDAMLAAQDQQTPGNLQWVADASADPGISEGAAYYEKLTGNTGTLATDYRRLTSGEVEQIEAGVYRVNDRLGTAFHAVLRTTFEHGFKISILPGGGFSLSLKPSIFTGHTIPLHNVLGSYQDAVSPEAVYTIAAAPAPVTGGWAKFKINVSQATLDTATLTEPEITGATKIAGSDFVVDTDMYIIVEQTISGAVEYWFAQIAEA